MFKSAIVLSNQHNIKIGGKLIGWKEGLTMGDPMIALRETCRSVSESNIVGIVGPELSREAILISPFSKLLGLPVISYSATDPELSDVTTYPNFYRTAPSDTIAASALVKLFNQFNWTSCVIIYQNDAFGSGAANAMNNAFNASNINVVQLIVYDIVKRTIDGDLKAILMNSPSRIAILWTESSYTSLILQEALNSNLVGPLFTWILSNKISFDSFNEIYYQNLIGMLLIEPVIGSVINAPYDFQLLNEAYNIWQNYENETYPGSTNVDYYALFAFDATWALIKSLEELCSSKINNSSSSCFSFIESSFCFDFRFNQYDLLSLILARANFFGVSGFVGFSNNTTDRTNGSYYSLKNVQKYVNGLNFVPVLEYVGSEHWRVPVIQNGIIWPGNSLTPPTDRALLQGVSLRIGLIESVPFIIVQNVTDENGRSTVQYTGYGSDLIQLLMDQLNFSATLILAPSNQTYTQTVFSVNKGVYDIVIGDVTVTAARSEVVGFSSPIYDNSLRLVVRQANNAGINFFAFLKPFSRRLWGLLLGACIYAGILMFIIERRNNQDLKERSIISQLTMSISNYS
ncbi:unnamed protein product [Rotaria sp. Silwood1]|nr:unnamed protein product [Rotaria sp. Silwood1]